MTGRFRFADARDADGAADVFAPSNRARNVSLSSEKRVSLTSPAPPPERRRPARADDQGGHEQPTELGAAPVRGGELGGGVLARIKNSLINVRLLLERSVAIHSFDASLFGGVATARLFIT